MADSKGPTSDSALARQMNEVESLEKIEESPKKEVNTVYPLSFLAGVALAPSCDKDINYNCTCDDCCCLEARELELQSANLHFFISRIDNIHKNLVEGLSEGGSLSASLPSLLFTCRPYFNHLESTARRTLSESTCSQLLNLSETLVNKLENLMLTFASNGFLSLVETETNSISHFHIGQCVLGSMQVTIFRYCQPMPYLGQVSSRLYKRMRWNVDRMEDAMQQPRKEEEMEIDYTEFYFLCFEDINTLPEEDNESISHSNVVRVWSIGKWIQVFPETDDINDWVLCKIPQGTYQKRVNLGSEEPSCRKATDCLLRLLTLDLKNSNQ